MKTQIFIFKGKEIEFIIDENGNAKVNATQMAKSFNKDVPDFLILKQTKNFINACLNNRNSGYLKIKTKDDLIVSKQKTGTLMHEVLALKFAAWLDADFEVWVFTTIRDILYKYAAERDGSIKRTVKLQNERDSIINKLAAKSPEFRNLQGVEKQLKKEKNKRRSLTIEQLDQAKTLFPDSLFAK